MKLAFASAVFAVSVTVPALIASSGCTSRIEGVGDPCEVSQEYDPAFSGFVTRGVSGVSVESPSFVCRTRLCLVNHFQGRTTCPYGQSATGMAPAGAPPCTTPAGVPVTARDDTGKAAPVLPQCVDRQPSQAVYCSCRCQNADGRTDDGAPYCDCPDGFKCQPLVSSIGASNETKFGIAQLSGSYCVKASDNVDSASTCLKTCDPVNAPCTGG